jgi:hypothetical protein
MGCGFISFAEQNLQRLCREVAKQSLLAPSEARVVGNSAQSGMKLDFMLKKLDSIVWFEFDRIDMIGWMVGS